MMITVIAAQFVCLNLPYHLQSPPSLPSSLNNLSSADLPWVFSCNYAVQRVIGFHGEFLR